MWYGSPSSAVDADGYADDKDTIGPPFDPLWGTREEKGGVGREGAERRGRETGGAGADVSMGEKGARTGQMPIGEMMQE